MNPEFPMPDPLPDVPQGDELLSQISPDAFYICHLERRIAELEHDLMEARKALVAQVSEGIEARTRLGLPLRSSAGSVAEMETEVRRLRSRYFVLIGAVRAFLNELQHNHDMMPKHNFRGEFYREWEELEELLKLIDRTTD